MHTKHAWRAEKRGRDGDKAGKWRVFWALPLVAFNVVQRRRLWNLISLSRASIQRAFSHEARPSPYNASPTGLRGELNLCIHLLQYVQPGQPQLKRFGTPEPSPRLPKFRRRHAFDPRLSIAASSTPFLHWMVLGVGIWIAVTELVIPSLGASVLGDTSPPHMAYTGS